jgi:RNA polymerase subunit RPABC4/transcription elongation factor Spt4
MNPEKFNEITQPLLKYNKKAERDQLKVEYRACEHCYKMVRGQRILCEVYRLGTPGQHFRHRCQQCKAVIFDGSMKKDCNRRPNLLESDVHAK